MYAPVGLAEAVQALLEAVICHISANADAADGCVSGGQLHALPKARLERLHLCSGFLAGAGGPLRELQCLRTLLFLLPQTP